MLDCYTLPHPHQSFILLSFLVERQSSELLCKFLILLFSFIFSETKNLPYLSLFILLICSSVLLFLRKNRRGRGREEKAEGKRRKGKAKRKVKPIRK